MIRIIQADATGDAPQLFPPRVARGEVPANVLQDAGHLAEQVIRGCDVEKVRLSGVEIAHRPFPKGAVAWPVQVSLGIQWRSTRGLSGRLDVGADAVHQGGARPVPGVENYPGAEGLQLLGPGERPLAPRRRHRPSNTRFARSSAEPGGGVLRPTRGRGRAVVITRRRARTADGMTRPVVGRCCLCLTWHGCLRGVGRFSLGGVSRSSDTVAQLQKSGNYEQDIPRAQAARASWRPWKTRLRRTPSVGGEQQTNSGRCIRDGSFIETHQSINPE